MGGQTGGEWTVTGKSMDRPVIVPVTGQFSPILPPTFWSQNSSFLHPARTRGPMTVHFDRTLAKFCELNEFKGLSLNICSSVTHWLNLLTLKSHFSSVQIIRKKYNTNFIIQT